MRYVFIFYVRYLISSIYFVKQACHLCGEPFEQFWEEDLEEWHYHDAVRTPDNLLYHVDCRKEAKDSEVCCMHR